MKKLNVALVGLSFGLEFVAIYCKHPDIDKVYIVDKNEKLLNIAKERYSIPDERCFTDLQDVLDIPECSSSCNTASNTCSVFCTCLKCR